MRRQQHAASAAQAVSVGRGGSSESDTGVLSMSSPAIAFATAGSLLPYVSAVRVSSVLNGAVAEYGKAHLLDGSPDTCWNSEQGSPQSVQLSFDRPVAVRSLEVTFQGGFVGQVNAGRCGAVRCAKHSLRNTPRRGRADRSALVRLLTCDCPPLCCAQPMEVSVVRSGSRRFEPYAVYDTADHNAPQLFLFHKPPPSAASVDSVRASDGVVALKLHFPASTDLFGRVTIYNLTVTGTAAASTEAVG